MDKLEKHKSLKGIMLMFFSAFLTATGQLMWKLSVSDNNKILLIIGFICYGIGALSMIIAFKFGELSVMYPLMCLSYVFAIINGYVFLDEVLSLKNLLGVFFIVIGISLIGWKSKE